jgi:protein associated with RNAse G/E
LSANNYIIKSFKYDGHLHRTWLENWLVPQEHLFAEHRDAGVHVCVNHNTWIQEANGKRWQSRIPGVTFFLPQEWYNVVALIEQAGIRYYCNLSSRPLLNGNVFTYIDYDLDVVLYPSGQVLILDQDEYECNSRLYQYPPAVLQKVERSVELLLERMERRAMPFDNDCVRAYHRMWKETFEEKRKI